MRAMTDIPVFRVTAINGKGVKQLLNEAVNASRRNQFTIGTGELNRWLAAAQEAHHVPSDDGSMVRMKYASQTGTNPPSFKIFCNRPGKLKPTYKRYLEQSFRKSFDLTGVPIRFSFLGGNNPYADKGK